ncbi:ABC-type transport auxiliary lipoprotein family protein [Parvularcula lutaonensis]|uniref:ABC-type transport auxiliary lipoprotein family protein n=1 Tax=Parvularcula lutaonensis TaxID=491923 RepID=A0ABV7MGM9_9PROT|nr:ABC-type transport auxiliary lipoprotein family protein [Parvularcula lutaonensis]GGY52550.1 hypothetical protein GCM10007148_22130 [Parvularcula lutaonensis]
MIRLLIALSATVFVSGCISLVPPPSELPPRYTLTAKDIVDNGTPLPVTLAVADARAEGALNTTKIAVLTAENEIRYMPDGEWSDRAPRVLSLLLERSFEERERLLAVSDRVALPIADYTIYADISAFNADRTRNPAVADVSFRVRLEDQRGRVLQSKRFDAQVPINGKDTRAAAQALNDAAAQAASEAAAWALELIEANEMDAS